MRRFITGFAACALLALAGTAVAQEEVNPFAAVEETVAALTASDEAQDTRLDRLERRLQRQHERARLLRLRLREERRQRRADDHVLAKCGMKASRRWVQQADGTWDLGAPNQERAWRCFSKARAEAHRIR